MLCSEKKSNDLITITKEDKVEDYECDPVNEKVGECTSFKNGDACLLFYIFLKKQEVCFEILRCIVSAGKSSHFLPNFAPCSNRQRFLVWNQRFCEA